MAKVLSTSKVLCWLLRKARKHRLQMVLNTLLGTMSVCLSLAFVWGVKWAVDIATGVVPGRLHMAVVLLVTVLFAQILFDFAERWVSALLGVRACNAMRAVTFRCLLEGTWQGMRRFHTTDVVNRVSRDADTVTTFLTEGVPTFISVFLQLIGAFVFMYTLNSRLAVVVLFVAPLFILLSKLYIKRLHKLNHEVKEIESQVLKCIQESLQHSIVVKTLERTGYVYDRLVGEQSRLSGKVKERTVYSSVSATVMSAGFTLGYLVTFVWGVYSLQAGLITYGGLTAFVQLVGKIQAPIRSLTRFVPYYISAATSAERLIELEDVECENPLEDKGLYTATVFDNGRSVLAVPQLVFDQVSYRYADDERMVIEGFSHVFRPGSVTALVGETGVGKTTLIRLMLALVRPCSGSIMLDGQPVSPASRRFFSYVPQGNTLLSGSIRDNLLMGNPSATDKELAEVLRLVAADFVYDFPRGLDTLCSELGGGLSEGQAQRLCIARALLRPSGIVIFDECTSALDADTERRVLANIIDSCRQRTLIFVTHRPAVLEFCSEKICFQTDV